MYQHKVFFKKDKIEYCGGQNRENSATYMFWADEWKGKQFAYAIGEVSNRTGSFTRGKDFGKLPLKNIQRLLSEAGYHLS